MKEEHEGIKALLGCESVGMDAHFDCFALSDRRRGKKRTDTELFSAEGALDDLWRHGELVGQFDELFGGGVVVRWDDCEMGCHCYHCCRCCGLRVACFEFGAGEAFGVFNDHAGLIADRL